MTSFLTSKLSLLIGTAVLGFAACTGGTIDPTEKNNDASGGGGNTVDAMPGAPDAGASEQIDATPVTEVLNIKFTTESAQGDYDPDHVVAAWIENSNGDFIHTMLRRSDRRTEHLVAWNDASGGDTTDAVTGATIYDNHDDPISLTWTLPSGLPDGTYTVRMETCDNNANKEGGAGDNNQGTFTFNKNGTAKKEQGLSNGGHSDVTIDYSGR